MSWKKIQQESFHSLSECMQKSNVQIIPLPLSKPLWFHRNHMVGTTMQPEMAIRDGSTENRVQWDLLF
jgi:hypothetical protein